MRTVSGGSRTSPPAWDDDPHRPGAASLPKTARNRPHRSISPHLGITLIRRGYPSRPFLAGQRLPYSGRAAAEAAARWETPSMNELDRRTLLAAATLGSMLAPASSAGASPRKFGLEAASKGIATFQAVHEGHGSQDSPRSETRRVG